MAHGRTKPLWLAVQRLVHNKHISDEKFRDIMAKVADGYGLEDRESRVDGLERLGREAVYEYEREHFVH